MREASLVIPLNREQTSYKACIAYVQGSLAGLAAHQGRLHAQEQAILNAYRYDQRKSSYLLGRLSAKKAIADLTNQPNVQDIWIDSGVFHFPVIKSPRVQNTQVSISHVEALGLSIAFPEAHPMGIDVEAIQAENEETLLTQVLEPERQLLADIGLDQLVGNTAIWNMKEAMSKVIKTGMMLDFRLFEVEQLTVQQGLLLANFKHFAQYKAFSYLGSTYAASVALPRRTETDYEAIRSFFRDLES